MKYILLYLLAFALASSTAVAGPRIIGNGGDVYALQFISYGEKILLYLQNSQLNAIDTVTLGKIINSAQVESTTKTLKLNGMDKDAINYPAEQKIIFNRARWGSMSSEERLALVLHEYLGLMGKEQANYEFSKLLLREMSKIEKVRQGSDSNWMLCQDDGLIVNVFEHRSGADKRVTNLTLIFGGWVLEGTLDDTNAGPVTLNDKQGRGSFVGDISISYDSRGDENHKLSLIGVMALNKNVVQANRTLKCLSKYANP